MRKNLTACAAALLIVLMVAPIAFAQETEGESITVEMLDVNGESLGQVELSAIPEGGVMVQAWIEGLTPGFHGFHVHGTGSCDATTERPFSSAGGHFAHAESDDPLAHPSHNGDMPSLLATQSGVAMLAFATDRFTLDDLFDEDGSAIIIHAGADNYGNIPADRYDPDADETTLNTGDAGGRAACGVIERE